MFKRVAAIVVGVVGLLLVKKSFKNEPEPVEEEDLNPLQAFFSKLTNKC